MKKMFCFSRFKDFGDLIGANITVIIDVNVSVKLEKTLKT
jgi:hypothetical protein